MPDPSLLQSLLGRLGVNLPDAPAPVSPEQQELYNQIALRNQGTFGRALDTGLKNAGEFLKGTFADPTMSKEQFDQTSPWKKGGMLAAAAPLSIPGMFSRVERVAEALPKEIHPNKLATILRSNASKEEVGWRGVDKLIEGAGNNKLQKQQVLEHLEQNPLKLEVAVKGEPTGRVKLINDSTGAEMANFPNQTRANQVRRDYPHHFEPEMSRTTYDSYVMPGAIPDTYRETLIKLDVPKTVKEIPEGEEITYARPIFTSHHWPEDNNTLVHVRANERELPVNINSKVIKDKNNNTVVVGEKGRMLENVQSDWHQRGAHGGYNSGDQTTSSAIGELQDNLNEASNKFLTSYQKAAKAIDEWHPDYDAEPFDILRQEDRNFIWNRLAKEKDDAYELGDTIRYNQLVQLQEEMRQSQIAHDQALDAVNRGKNEAVPDAPFKDSWAELALKQQLLDIAHNRPDLEWIGIAPSSELNARGEDISPAFQDVQLPNTLGKLLKPFGGKVEKADLGIKSAKEQPAFNPYIGPYGGFHFIDAARGASGDMDEVLSLMPGADRGEMRQILENQTPNVKAFIARLSPEMKERIKQSGFPMLAALLMAQQSEQQSER